MPRRGSIADSEVEGGGLHAVRIVYRVRITGGELRDEVDGSTDTCAWFTREEADRLHLGDLARRRAARSHARARRPSDWTR